jgi:Protein of unknown function (DUF4231)
MSNSPTVPMYDMPSRSSDPTWDRMEDQIDWYDRKSIRYQKVYKRIKLIEIIAAAAIPFLAALNISQGNNAWFSRYISWIIGGLGVLITILEGVLQLNQYQQNWVSYRSACEGLKHEKYAYLAKAAPYRDATAPPDPHALLAERVESLVSQEHAKWAAVQQQGVKIKGVGEGAGDGERPKS